MQGADKFYDAMREANFKSRYQSLLCKACNKEIRGYDSMDALDILISHFTGNPHRKKARQLAPDDEWQEFISRGDEKRVWLNHRTGEVWKGRQCRYRPSDWESGMRTLNWWLWQKTLNMREQREDKPLTQFQGPWDKGDGSADEVDTSPLAYDEPDDPAAWKGGSLKQRVVDLKHDLWEEMVANDEESRDLTNSDLFDWRTYLKQLQKMPPDLADEAKSFKAEIHRTAWCSWTNRPQFHFAVETNRFRILVNQPRGRSGTLIYYDHRRNFLAIGERPDGRRIEPTPKEQDVCAAFGGNCFFMRKLKNKLLDGSKCQELSYRNLVRRFLRLDADSDLLEHARDNDLLEFDEARLIWRLSQDEMEKDWRLFLQSQGQKLAPWRLDDAFWNFDQEMNRQTLHEDISLAVEQFSKQQDHQRWQECCRQINRCDRCRRDFYRVLEAETHKDAFREVQWHFWHGASMLKVSEIYYTHDTINSRFKDHRWTLEDTVHQLQTHQVRVQDIPALQVMYYHGRYFSIDNRRLWCFKKFAEWSGAELWIPVQVHCIAGPGKILQSGPKHRNF